MNAYKKLKISQESFCNRLLTQSSSSYDQQHLNLSYQNTLSSFFQPIEVAPVNESLTPATETIQEENKETNNIESSSSSIQNEGTLLSEDGNLSKSLGPEWSQKSINEKQEEIIRRSYKVISLFSQEDQEKLLSLLDLSPIVEASEQEKIRQIITNLIEVRDRRGNSKKKIAFPQNTLKYNKYEALFKVFEAKFCQMVKSKEEMIKFCMRKAFKFIYDKIAKNTKFSKTEQKSLKNEYFGISGDTEYALPFREDSAEKTMNDDFLKKTFALKNFVSDYKEFLENYDEILEKDNNNKITILVEQILNMDNEDFEQGLQKIKRIPWSRETLEQTKQLARYLLQKYGIEEEPQQIQEFVFKAPAPINRNSLRSQPDNLQCENSLEQLKSVQIDQLKKQEEEKEEKNEELRITNLIPYEEFKRLLLQQSGLPQFQIFLESIQNEFIKKQHYPYVFPQISSKQIVSEPWTNMDQDQYFALKEQSKIQEEKLPQNVLEEVRDASQYAKVISINENISQEKESKILNFEEVKVKEEGNNRSQAQNEIVNKDEENPKFETILNQNEINKMKVIFKSEELNFPLELTPFKEQAEVGSSVKTREETQKVIEKTNQENNCNNTPHIASFKQILTSATLPQLETTHPIFINSPNYYLPDQFQHQNPSMLQNNPLPFQFTQQQQIISHINNNYFQQNPLIISQPQAQQKIISTNLSNELHQQNSSQMPQQYLNNCCHNLQINSSIDVQQKQYPQHYEYNEPTSEYQTVPVHPSQNQQYLIASQQYLNPIQSFQQMQAQPLLSQRQISFNQQNPQLIVQQGLLSQKSSNQNQFYPLILNSQFPSSPPSFSSQPLPMKMQLGQELSQNYQYSSSQKDIIKLSELLQMIQSQRNSLNNIYDFQQQNPIQQILFLSSPSSFPQQSSLLNVSLDFNQIQGSISADSKINNKDTPQIGIHHFNQFIGNENLQMRNPQNFQEKS